MSAKKPRDLKRLNRKRVLDTVRATKEVTVAEISRSTGLSRTIVMRIIRHFQDAGLIRSNGKGHSTDEGGKRPELFQFCSQRGYVAVTHIFPQQLYTGLTDLDGNILGTRRSGIKKDLPLQSVIERISEDIGGLLEELDLARRQLIGVAIGAHGICNIDEGTVIFSPHFPSWEKHAPFAQMLKEAIGPDIPVYVDNQIRFQALAEQQKGEAKGTSDVVVLEGGLGLVSGIIIGGTIQRGRNYLAGEIGHIVVDPEDGVLCHCGNRGCLERKIAVDTLLQVAKEQARHHPASSISASAEEGTLCMERIFEASDARDPFACQLLDFVVKWFSLGLSNISLTLNPELIVIQGIYGNASLFFRKKLQERLVNGLFANLGNIPEVRYSTLGENRCIMGGSIFVVERYFEELDFAVAE